MIETLLRRQTCSCQRLLLIFLFLLNGVLSFADVPAMLFCLFSFQIQRLQKTNALAEGFSFLKRKDHKGFQKVLLSSHILLLI